MSGSKYLRDAWGRKIKKEEEKEGKKNSFFILQRTKNSKEALDLLKLLRYSKCFNNQFLKCKSMQQEKWSGLLP